MNGRLPSATAIASALLVLIGGAALYGAVRMVIGTPDVPDAGFFPLLAALILVVLAAVLFIDQMRRPTAASAEAGEETAPSLRAALPVIAGFAAYVPALEWLGFLVATALLVALLLAVFGIRRPLPYAAAVPLIAGGSYLLFHLLLGLPLPVGPAGF